MVTEVFMRLKASPVLQGTEVVVIKKSFCAATNINKTQGPEILCYKK